MAQKNRPGFLTRIGLSFVAPKRAFEASESRPGVAASDVMALLFLYAIVISLGSVVRGGWAMVLGDFKNGLAVLTSVLMQGAKGPLLAIFLAAIAAFAMAWPSRRIGRAFDLASVATVPLVVVYGVGALFLALRIAPNIPLTHYLVSGLGISWTVFLLWQCLKWIKTDPTTIPPPASRWPILIGSLAVLCLLGIGLVHGKSVYTHWDSFRPMVPGDAAPPVVVRRINMDGRLGEDVSLESLRGKVVLMDFWATWCKPCKRSMPVLDELSQKFSKQGLVVLSINTEGADFAASARRMVEKLAPNVELVSDVNLEASRAYRAVTIPFMVLIDRDGVVRSAHAGFSSESSLLKNLNAAIADAL